MVMPAAIRFVLVDTSHPGNIGASARAMKNMGLESLVLVRPQAHGDPESTARAAGATDVLDRAQVVDSVDEAVSDCGLVIGTTARQRAARFRVLDAREAARELCAAAAARPVAVLFGGERNGLANEELARCQALLRIPVDAAYESLNLAQAVQIVAYEIGMAMRDGSAAAGGIAGPPATAKEMAALEAHLDAVMTRVGFMHAANAEQLAPRVHRILSRASPDDGDVRILRGLLAAIDRRTRPED